VHIPTVTFLVIVLAEFFFFGGGETLLRRIFRKSRCFINDDDGPVVVVHGATTGTAHVGRSGVLDGQGGRGFGVGRDRGGRPTAVRGHRDVGRPLAVGSGPRLERRLSGGRGAPDRRGNVAGHRAGRHAIAAGLVLRHRVRRRVVRVRVRVLRRRLAGQDVGDLRPSGGRHVAPAVHGRVFELGRGRSLGRRRRRRRRRRQRREKSVVGGHRRPVARVPDRGVSGRTVRDGR